MSRRSSLSKLLSNVSSHSWRNDSDSSTLACSSCGSFTSRGDRSCEEQRQVLLELQLDLDQEIETLGHRKSQLEARMESNLELAMARYSNHGTSVGLLVCMRQAVQSKAQKAVTAAARFQLIQLRQQVRNAMKEESSTTMSTHEINAMRKIMQETLERLQSVPMSCPRDEELLAQLQNLMW